MHYKQRFVRVFISSTFSDMMPEREYLMKIIFPELRKRCKTKFIELTEVDLRWGIPEEDSKEGKVIEICLNEIDNSRPYFIGILGNRYGWIPGKEEYEKHSKILESFPWIKDDIEDQLSITEMEIQYGVLRNKEMEQKAFFYYKDFNDNTSEGEKATAKLEKLKSKIKEKAVYPLKPYQNIEALGAQILEDLWQQIEKDFPDDEIPDEHEQEKLNHMGFMNNHLNFFYDYNKTVEHAYALLSRNSELLIYGEKGQGKSAIASNFIKQTPGGTDSVFYFCGATAESTSLENMAKHIANELKRKYTLSLHIPQKVEHPHDLLSAFIQAVPANEPVYIVLDGIEQLVTDQYNSRLQWIPEDLPSHVKLLITTSSPEHAEIVRNQNISTLELETIVPEAIKSITENYYSFYAKKLPEKLIDKIQYYPLAGKPIVLFTLLNELRIFGVHEKLDAHITFYTGNKSTEDFFTAFLNRLDNDFNEKEFNLKGILTSLYFSNNGLTEKEIIEINQVSQLRWSQLYNVIEYHLINKNGVLKFNNPYISEAIHKKYIINDNEKKQLIEPVVAYFFQLFQERKNEENEQFIRLIDELPELLLEAEKKEQLKDVITNIPIIVQLFKKKHEKIPYYFSVLKEQFPLHEIYESNFDEFTQTKASYSEKIEAGFFIGNLLFSHSNPAHAIPFYNKVLQLFVEEGTQHYYVIEALKDLSSVYSQLGNFEAAAYMLENLLPYLQDENLVDTISMLAQLYMETGNFGIAEILYMDSIMFLLHRFGKNNIRVALEYNNLGRLHDIQKNLALAEENYLLASKIAYNAVGPKHNLYQTIQSNIGILYLNNQKLEAAEEIFNNVLSIRLETLGEHHRKTLKTMNSLGVCKSFQGKLEEGLQILVSTYEKQNKLLGNAHSDTLLTQSNIADIYKRNNQFDEAERILRNIVDTRIKHYGAMHEQTIYSSMALADVLVASEKQDEAVQLYESIIKVCNEFYGEKSQLTYYVVTKYNELINPKSQQQTHTADEQLDQLLNEANAFVEKEDFFEAEKKYLELIDIVEKQYNGVHPAIFSAYDNMSAIYHRTKNYRLAADYAKKLVDIAQKTYGDAEPATLEYKIIQAFNLHKAAFHQDAYGILVDLGKHHVQCLNFPKEFIANFYKHMLNFYQQFTKVVDNYNNQQDAYKALYNEVVQLTENASEFFRDNNINEAVKAYNIAIEKAHELNKTFGVAYEVPFQYKASLLEYENNDDEAMQVLQEGIDHVCLWNSELDEKAFYLYKIMGDIFLKKNNTEKALQHFSLAERINRNCEDYPNSHTIAINNAHINLYQKASMPEEALTILQDTIPLAIKFYGKKHDATRHYIDLEKELKKEIKQSKK